MADPILHIKDAYFFEVPHALWHPHYESLEDVPSFLVKAHATGPDGKMGTKDDPEHPIVDPDVYADAMAGKILIPQPFGSLNNLYERDSGFVISKFMVIQVTVAVIMVAVFTAVAKRLAKSDAPRGKFVNMFEGILVFLRDEVARPAIGKHDADRFVPLLWTMFFFILFCNLMGMIPWVGSPTGSWGVTLALALVTLFTVIGAGIKQFGFVGFWKNQVPHMELPWYMAPILIPAIWLIEVLGIFIRHAVLSIRLLANMFAGHLVLLSIMGLMALVAASAAYVKWPIWGVIVLGTVFLSILEMFVAFLQAYIFTFLSALFIGAAVHKH